MPRQARLDIAGHLYHVLARGNERRKIFCDEKDYADFLTRLKKTLQESDNRCLAWCQMPNHFHLLILRGTKPLAQLMRRLMTGYAVSFNLRHKRSGHLFQNRYKAILCDAEEYLLQLMGYIHLNPLRSGLVKNMEELEEYTWCGHGVLTGKRKADFLAKDYVLGYFGDKKKEAVRKYKDFLAENSGKYKSGEYSGGGLVRSLGGSAKSMDMKTNGDKEAFDDRILGRGDFVDAILKKADENLQKNRDSVENVKRKVEKLSNASFREILSRSRERRIARARSLYCYLAKEKAGITGTQLMEELKVSSSGISRLASQGKEVYLAVEANK